MDRRTTIRWVLAASVASSLSGTGCGRAVKLLTSQRRGYGHDPDLLAVYRPGKLWPLTLTVSQRRLAGVLADLIIPPDEHSPGASSVGIVDFIDEWVSAPYPTHLEDRPIVLDGLAWLDAEAGRRFGRAFADLATTDQRGICDDICDESRAAAERRDAARFFARFRDLTAGGFYSSAVGRNDLRYLGNVPRASFDGPPAELLRKLSLP
jgi:Gluconate 2-dehydrogenase subunit 3